MSFQFKSVHVIFKVLSLSALLTALLFTGSDGASVSTANLGNKSVHLASNNTKVQVSERIVGGYDAPSETLQRMGYVAVLFRRESGETYWKNGCSGSIISRNRVLTAAHCVTPRKRTGSENDKIVDAFVWVGEKAKENARIENARRVKWIHAHVKLNRDPSPTIADIAIATLHDDHILPENYPTMTLPLPDETFKNRIEVFAAGYGLQGPSRNSEIGVAKEVALMKRILNFCTKWSKNPEKQLERFSSTPLVCASAKEFQAGGQGICGGDSGGPLFFKQGDTYLQIGINQLIVGKCGSPRSRSYYVQVSAYVWDIENHFVENFDSWDNLFEN